MRERSFPGRGAPAYTLIELTTGATNGFTSAEEDGGYADYGTSVAGSCIPDPRDQTYQVTPEMAGVHLPPISVSYRHATGSTLFTNVADLNAAAAVVSSIRFPQLHEGTPAVSGYFVAGRASSYRPGSVTRITGVPRVGQGSPTAILVNDGGFHEFRTGGYRHGYDCDLRVDRRNRAIVCTNGAVWDLDGRVVRNPDPARYEDEPLLRETAPVSYDGHVLLP